MGMSFYPCSSQICVCCWVVAIVAQNNLPTLAFLLLLYVFLCACASPSDEEEKKSGPGFEGKFFEGMGTGQDVPKFLKYKGKVSQNAGIVCIFHVKSQLAETGKQGGEGRKERKVKGGRGKTSRDWREWSLKRTEFSEKGSLCDKGLRQRITGHGKLTPRQTTASVLLLHQHPLAYVCQHTV